jgi:hypothetical protein
MGGPDSHSTACRTHKTGAGEKGAKQSTAVELNVQLGRPGGGEVQYHPSLSTRKGKKPPFSIGEEVVYSNTSEDATAASLAS